MHEAPETTTDDERFIARGVDMGEGVKAGSQMRLIFQITAWVLLIAIVVLSLSPPLYRPVTIFPHAEEHLTIFLAAGLAFGVAYPQRRQLRVLSLLVFAAGIELCQLFVPGRHARLSDFLTDATAISLGVWLGFILVKRAASHPHGPLKRYRAASRS